MMIQLILYDIDGGLATKQKQTIKQVNLKNESFNTMNPFSGNNINWNSINLNYRVRPFLLSEAGSGSAHF